MAGIFGIDIPTWLAIVIVSVYALNKYLRWNFGWFANSGIKGPKPWILVGTFFEPLRKGFHVYDLQIKEKYGKLVATFLGRSPQLVVFDLDILKEIVIKKFDNFQNHTRQGLEVYPQRKFITQLESEHWKHVRNTLTPAFTGGKLRKMEEAVNRCVRTTLSHLEKKALADEPVAIKDTTSSYTMDVIASTAFGIDIDTATEGENNQFVKAGRNALDTFKNLLSPKVLLIIFFPKLIELLKLPTFNQGSLDFFLDVINKTLDDRKAGENEEGRRDFIQMMAENFTDDPTETDVQLSDDVQISEMGHIYSKTKLTREEILAQAFLFFIAGFGTTSTTLQFLFYNLACNQEQQQKLYEEIKEQMADQDEPDYDIVKKMPYLQMCIEETLRLTPPAPRTDRACMNDVTINGVDIKAGTSIAIPVYAIHHDPGNWEEPEIFNPERFTAEEKAARHPMAWLPFGQGPRNCIGMRLALMEMKFIAAQVVRKFKVVTCPETQIPFEMSTSQIEPTSPIKIKFEIR